MVTTEQVTGAVERYASAVASADIERILACFSDDARVVDPYPADANVGHEGVRGFWEQVLLMGAPCEFVIERLSVCGDRAAFDFSTTAALGDGSQVAINGIEIVEVDDEGQIRELTAYWDPSRVRMIAAQ